MGNIGPLEVAVVLIIALMVFGPKRLPELGRSVGKGMREFKNAIAGADVRDELSRPVEPEPAKSPVSEPAKSPVNEPGGQADEKPADDS